LNSEGSDLVISVSHFVKHIKNDRNNIKIKEIQENLASSRDISPHFESSAKASQVVLNTEEEITKARRELPQIQFSIPEFYKVEEGDVEKEDDEAEKVDIIGEIERNDTR